MAAAQAIVGSAFFERKTADGLREAGDAVGLAQSAKLWRLSVHLGRLNNLVRAFLSVVEEHGNSASSESSVLPSREQVEHAVDSLISLHMVMEEIYRRSRAHRFTNCSRFGVSRKLGELRELSDRVWGLADWLALVLNPSEVDQRMADGLAEIERGDSVRID